MERGTELSVIVIKVVLRVYDISAVESIRFFLSNVPFFERRTDFLSEGTPSLINTSGSLYHRSMPVVRIGFCPRFQGSLTKADALGILTYEVGYSSMQNGAGSPTFYIVCNGIDRMVRMVRIHIPFQS